MKLLSSLIVLSAIAVTASATPITGRLIVNGVTLVGDSITTIDFNYPGCGSTSPICPAPPASNSSTGSFLVGSGSTMSFAPLIGSTGYIRSFDVNQAPPGVDLSTTMGGTIPNFITFASAPNYVFSLRQVNKGSFSSAQCLSAPAPGQTCTPVLPGGVTSPLELSNSTGDPSQGDKTGLNSHAQFSLLVDAINLSTGERSRGTGTFSTDFSGYSYQTLLNAAANNQVITTGYHGDFTITFSAIPEPASISYALTGALLLGVGGLLKKIRS